MNGIQVVNAADIFKKTEKHYNDLSIRHYGEEAEKYRHISYDPEFKTIDIQNGSGGIYDVPLSRCSTAAACLDWIHQLHVKTWFDAEREKEFIDLLLRLIPSSLWSGEAH